MQRDRARIGLANGEEKFLPAKDRGAQKKHVRDIVDSRWGFAELTIPLLFVMIVVSYLDTALTQYVTFGLWALVLLIAIDLIVLHFRIKRLAAEKFGEDRVERRGLYHATRAIQLRVMRLPKPQVKRGESLEGRRY